jgi:hypothetical protein
VSCGRGCYEIGGPWITCDPGCPEHGAEARGRAKRTSELEAEVERLKAKVAGYDALVMSYEDVIEFSSKWLHDSCEWYGDETLAPKWQDLWDRHAELAK